MFLYLATYSDTVMLLLRLALGGILVVHGWPKIRNLKKTAADFSQMGIKPGALFGSIVAFLEFFGGIALVLGILTQSVAILFAIQFAVIVVWRLAKKMPFVGGWELHILILASVLLLVSLGAGAYSLDAYFFIFGF